MEFYSNTLLTTVCTVGDNTHRINHELEKSLYKSADIFWIFYHRVNLSIQK